MTQGMIIKTILPDIRIPIVLNVRHAIMYCLHIICNVNTPHIGRLLLREHNAVLKGIENIENEKFVYAKTGVMGERLKVVKEIEPIFIKGYLKNLSLVNEYSFEIVNKND